MIPGEEVESPPPPQKKKNTGAQPPSFSSAPDEIAERCLARISRWNYRRVSLVSKRFRSIVSSPLLYAERSLIGNTEPCLYICFKLPDQPSPNWFSLCMKPPPNGDCDDATRDNNDDLPIQDYDYSLVRVPSYSYAHKGFEPIVAVGSEIYSIGGGAEGRSAAVRILDCRSHTWRDGPDMLVAREVAAAVLLDEKVYVMGGCKKDEPWMEVLDIKTQTWRTLPSLFSAELGSVLEDWFVISPVHGKIIVIGDEKDYAYDPKEDTWEVVRTHSGFEWWTRASCVVDNVIYSYIAGSISWYDPKSRKWSEVMGPDLQMLYQHHTCGLRQGCVLGMVSHGGKLFVIWDPYLRYWVLEGKHKRGLRCAKIALEKRNGGDEVWGKLEWVNTVLMVDKLYDSVGCVVVSI